MSQKISAKIIEYVKKKLDIMIERYRIYPSDYKVLSKSSKILDVPCGKGIFISNNPEKIIGVDNNPSTIAYCQSKGYNVTLQDAFSMDFPDGSFDAIHCAHLIEHLQPSELGKFINELDRLLAKGGLLIIRAPMPHNLFYNEVSHIRPYPPASIMNLYNLVSGGDRTLTSELNYKFVDLKFYHRNLFQFSFEVAVNKQKYFFYAVLRVLGTFLGEIRIKYFKRTEYSLVMRKN